MEATCVEDNLGKCPYWIISQGRIRKTTRQGYSLKQAGLLLDKVSASKQGTSMNFTIQKDTPQQTTVQSRFWFMITGDLLCFSSPPSLFYDSSYTFYCSYWCLLLNFLFFLLFASSWCSPSRFVHLLLLFLYFILPFSLLILHYFLLFLLLHLFFIFIFFFFLIVILIIIIIASLLFFFIYFSSFSSFSSFYSSSSSTSFSLLLLFGYLLFPLLDTTLFIECTWC